jgi:hypothetical protein
MKYLKRYNENKSQFEIELQEFCNTYLAYLKDIGFTIRIDSNEYSGTYKSDSYYMIDISQSKEVLDPNFVPNPNFNINFSWDKVSDDLIPFYEMLDRNYKISYFRMVLTGAKFISPNRSVAITISKEDIINDNVNDLINRLKKTSDETIELIQCIQIKIMK